MPNLPFTPSTTTWLNPPTTQTHTPPTLTFRTHPETDAYRSPKINTANAHILHLTAPLSGDFTITTRYHGDYAAQYDQAGLSVYLDAENWIKTGIEFFEGAFKLSAVVTRGWSDWSVRPFFPDYTPDAERPGDCWVRVVRKDGDIDIEISKDGKVWELLRQTFGWTQGVHVGVMAAAPVGQGFEVVFEEVTVEV